MDLAEAGISVDCLPLLDVRQPGAHDVIGDRALGREPQRVAALGRATLDGLARAGVAGVVKHIPGHGRALADSHKELPTVTACVQELELDLAPFRALSGAGIAMTAHVRYTAWDAQAPGTLSPIVVGEVIRKTIGFDGLLLSDDLDMEALSGTVPERAARAGGGLRPRAQLLGEDGRHGGHCRSAGADGRGERAASGARAGPHGSGGRATRRGLAGRPDRPARQAAGARLTLADGARSDPE
jgi:hypothetical protein